jgi:hypothetical protein
MWLAPAAAAGRGRRCVVRGRGSCNRLFSVSASLRAVRGAQPRATSGNGGDAAPVWEGGTGIRRGHGPLGASASCVVGQTLNSPGGCAGRADMAAKPSAGRPGLPGHPAHRPAQRRPEHFLPGLRKYQTPATPAGPHVTAPSSGQRPARPSSTSFRPLRVRGTSEKLPPVSGLFLMHLGLFPLPLLPALHSLAMAL